MGISWKCSLNGDWVGNKPAGAFSLAAALFPFAACIARGNFEICT